MKARKRHQLLRRVKASAVALAVMICFVLGNSAGILEVHAATSATVQDGTYFIKNVNSGKYLDVTNGSSEDGANIQQYAFNGRMSQVFKIQSVGNGYYAILTGASNYEKCVDVYNGSTEDGANINQWTYWGGDMQLFQIVQNADGSYSFLSKVSGGKQAIEVYEFGKNSGVNVCQWSYWGGANQCWILEKYTSSDTTDSGSSSGSARQVESLSRGLTVTGLSSGVLVNWRYLGTDTENTTFKLYRDSQLIYTSEKDQATCYKDAGGSINSTYTLRVYSDANSTNYESYKTEYKLSYDSSAKGGYFDVKLDVPTDSRLGATYAANDSSVADLDGDGNYELIVKWEPSNAQDNSKDGATSNVIIDAYELEPGDATRLWRIDLGQNIRAGAHYTQFMVYDFDGDGKAEMVCKTAPGSKDGQGNYVSKASSISDIKNANDNSKSYVNSAGRILSGNEYLTLFDGETGKALDTIYYEPGRGTVSDWGDSYGNRVDRFLGAVAYLDGKTPSVVMCRGYYTRTVLVAYNVVNDRLVKQWTFDSNNAGSSYEGQGNHNLATADVDNDGKDEIVYGSMTIDHDGDALYNSRLGHGDALHVGDFVPNNGVLEIYMVHENSPYGASLRNAKTGEMIRRWTGSSDTGRGLADNLAAGNNGAEFVSAVDSVVYNSSGSKVTDWSAITKWNINSLIYWDGDPEREVLDRTMIDDYPNGRIFTGQGITYNNGSKSNVCITADLFGDWREEMVAALYDGSGVRVYATTYDTDYRVYTLMHNTQYRCGVAAENVGYNQPPHVDYWFDSNASLPKLPNVYAVGNGGTGGTGTDAVTPTATPKPTAEPTAAPTQAPKPTTAPSSGVAYTGSVTITGANWWAAKDIAKSDLLGGVDPSAVTAIKFSGSTEFFVGYNATSGYIQPSGQKEYTVTDMVLDNNYYLQLCLSKNDNVAYTFKWEVYTDAASAPNTSVTPTATPNPTEAPTQAPQATPVPTATPASTAVPTQAPTTEAGSYVHNFTTEGKTSTFFDITGNLSTSKGTVTYNGMTLSQCLKMESSTKITFTTDADAELVLVFSVEKKADVKVDGKKYDLTNGILTLDIGAGTHTITKGKTANLFYMEVNK